MKIIILFIKMLEFKNYNKSNKWCVYTNVRIKHYNNNKIDKNVYASIHETQNMQNICESNCHINKNKQNITNNNKNT